MKNENRKDEQRCNDKNQKNLEFAKEFDAKKNLRNEKDCRNDCKR